MTPFAGNFNRAVAAAKREKAKADEALARERELVPDVVALRFDPEAARRVRPVPEAVDGPDGICDARSRASAGTSAEDLLHGLGLSDGRSP